MSFDIEKRFRFVSSDDIDVKEEDYQANDEIIIEEDTETKKIKERKEAVSEDLEESKNNFDNLDDNNKEEEDDDEEEDDE
ncbi:MAG: hypothetical protein US71_C0013G0010 [Parcubacteria group bacterium GW2011_GWD2_38_12]|uniref:Uncharacterized protein n=1 Tax=Candidatus Azambacteria bacterium RIFCSPLOWO2_01_FULL_37_9 TaxID=1797297 RepID=A0A1F5C963_9BACT|nr:MAG: hypothetical protein US06_C0012G0009 [Parcubacteria group bacterium GW2011_GWC2_36_17]KKQ39218.1 MAG: hypothetical protein US56_C0022G0004 [Candidatus Moranbacteria bacterium GW2011_GWF2_37_7]KKQ43103.1 MAG: hypothetical protein US61_C0016G0009 [Parcubacteria group bacterium GW2011_GWE2_37_8]KKQ51342.1 MAG: hypothetical protein US71_C0013G0010 [Parcubacteria group bacterium GW2011_GWD2_38_12]KKQ58769.1 MAG: hypothetical protein US79_C0003G0070 [Parcubacteria group bacterium GW2011_GWC1_